MEILNKIKNKINSDIHLKELLKGSSIAFVLRIVSIIAGYIFTLLITRGYGAEAMGVFALSFTLLQISSVIGRLGMDTALLRFVAEYSSQGKWEIVKDIYKKAIKLVLPFSILISILVFFLSPYIAQFIFKKPHLEPYFKIASIGIVPFVLLFIHTESLRGLKKIKEYMLLQQAGIFILASILLGFITLLLTNNQLTFLNQIPISIYIFSVFIISLIAFVIWREQFNNHPLTTANNKLTSTNSSLSYSTILSVSVPMLFTSMLTFVMAWTDTIMIGIFLNEEEVGIYSIALRISYIISFILFAINSITAPKIASEFSKKNFREFKKLSQFTSKMGIIYGVLTFIFIIFLGKDLLKIFGTDFEIGFMALILLSFGQLFNTSVGSIGYILAMVGEQHIMSFIIFIAFFLNIILNLYLIPLYGINGAAVATMISTIIWNLLGLVYIRYKYKFWNIKIWVF